MSPARLHEPSRTSGLRDTEEWRCNALALQYGKLIFPHSHETRPIAAPIWRHRSLLAGVDLPALHGFPSSRPIPMRISCLGFPALLLALAAGACRDLPTAAPAAQPLPQAAARAELKCSVAVTTRSMTCEASRPRGARSQIIMGGQGLNVRLRTTNLVVNTGAQLVTADISVQNLLDQPIGTDGTSTHGVRVFFVSGPTVTDGSGGQVDVLTDSIAVFTAANQKYYAYHEIIQPRGVSSPQQWAFSLPGGTTAFEFKVLVETEIPAEQS